MTGYNITRGQRKLVCFADRVIKIQCQERAKGGRGVGATGLFPQLTRHQNAWTRVPASALPVPSTGNSCGHRARHDPWYCLGQRSHPWHWDWSRQFSPLLQQKPEGAPRSQGRHIYTTEVTQLHANYTTKEGHWDQLKRGYISGSKITVKKVLRVNVRHSGYHLFRISEDFHVCEFPAM